jgi:hypothetical protein
MKKERMGERRKEERANQQDSKTAKIQANQSSNMQWLEQQIKSQRTFGGRMLRMSKD